MSKTRRYTQQQKARVSLRMDGDVEKYITGYAAVFYRAGDAATEYRMWDDYVERLMPGCFDRALSEQHDARGLFNHDSNCLLGRVANGTCSLSVDDVGLRFEIPIDLDDLDFQTVVPKIRRGDLSGCSFAFGNATSEWIEQQDDGRSIWIRNVTDLDLFDVGPVTYPAYEATEVGVRTSAPSKAELVEARSALSEHQNSLFAHRQNVAEQIEVDFLMAQAQQKRIG